MSALIDFRLSRQTWYSKRLLSKLKPFGFCRTIRNWLSSFEVIGSPIGREWMCETEVKSGEEGLLRFVF